MLRVLLCVTPGVAVRFRRRLHLIVRRLIQGDQGVVSFRRCSKGSHRGCAGWPPTHGVNQAGFASVIIGMKPYALTAAAALSILLASCSSSSTTTRTTPAPSAAAKPAAAASGSQASGGIVISGFAFSGTLTVKPGQKVTVTNQDSAAHTLTDKKSHLFDTGIIAGSGGTGTFTAPSRPGSYPFGCTFHPGMEGTLTVHG